MLCEFGYGPGGFGSWMFGAALMGLAVFGLYSLIARRLGAGEGIGGPRCPVCKKEAAAHWTHCPMCGSPIKS